MKFFSNEAKDDSGYDREHSDVVTSDPVAVPQQRAGSPWNDAPGGSTDTDTTHTDADTTDTDGELADRERRDGTDEALSPDEAHTTTTTYGPNGSVQTTSDEESKTAEGDTGETAVKDEGTFDSPEAVEPATGDPLDESEGDEPESRRDVVDAEAPASPDSELEAETEARADAADGRHAAEDTDDTTSPDEGDEPEEPEIRRDVVDAEPAAAVDTDADTDAEEKIDGAAVAVEPVPVPVAFGATTGDAPVAAASTPGSVPAPALDRLFTDGDSFAERFREIQLRFVDTPKEATADAAALVGEAVDRLTAALTAQKEALGGDSDDTEQLRVQLRSYRDLLNRLSAL